MVPITRKSVIKKTVTLSGSVTLLSLTCPPAKGADLTDRTSQKQIYMDIDCRRNVHVFDGTLNFADDRESEKQ